MGSITFSVWAVLDLLAAVAAGLALAQVHSPLVKERLRSILMCASKGHPLGQNGVGNALSPLQCSLVKEDLVTLLLKTCLEGSACQYCMGHSSFTIPKGMGAESVGPAEKGQHMFRDPLYLKMVLCIPEAGFFALLSTLVSFLHVSGSHSVLKSLETLNFSFVTQDPKIISSCDAGHWKSCA